MNVAGKQLSNGALAVAGGLVVGLVDTFLPWHSTTIPVAFGTTSGSHDALGYWSGWIFFLAIPALPSTDAMIYLAIGVVMLLCALLWLVTGGGYSGLYDQYATLAGYSSGPSFGVFIGIIAAAAVAIGGYLAKSDPQPATAP